ncbi:hypothetical protein Q7P35_008203 [Cladosporium inversicolor]
MTSTLPQPASLPRNDSFSTDDITRAFQASESKPRNNLSLRVVQADEICVPPPSPLPSRPASVFGFPQRKNS